MGPTNKIRKQPDLRWFSAAVHWDQRDALDFACFETTAVKPSGGKSWI